MNNSDFGEIAETLSLAKLYIHNLNTLKTEIIDVEKQIQSTYTESEQSIRRTFSNLRDFLCKNLENREKELLDKANKIKTDGLQPLKQCEAIIAKNIENTMQLIEEGSKISHSEPGKIIQFLEKASVLGNLPEVPDSKQVPYISFYYEPSVESQLESLCFSFGDVFPIAPIQIKSITPKPGALLIQWQQGQENCDEKVRDIQEFKLQRAFGDVVTNKMLAVNFIDCYQGPDTQYFLRDIQISQQYSFRVCCKFDGTTGWSPWSIPQIGLTDLPWFFWEPVEGVCLSNEGKIVALKENLWNNGKCLLSNGPQVSLTDSVEFTILECDPKSEISLALCTSATKLSKEANKNMFVVDSNGKISIDGTEKSTFLPKFTKGLKVCFSLEPVNLDKVRVGVDCNDKCVTYDWPIENAQLYFACRLMPRWKVMVE